MLKKITVPAFAKLNFNLHILPEKLSNGFFKVKFLNHQAVLADDVVLEETSKGIELTCDDLNLACDETNLAYRAAQAICDWTKNTNGVKIRLKKKVPVTGGLGGGSADAAAVILGLDFLWDLKLTDQEKLEIAKDLGMDVCYSVIGGTCLIEGGGEKVSRLNFSLPKMTLLIVSPSTHKPSTAWAYKTLDPDKIGRNLGKLEKMIEAVKKKDVLSIAQNLHNDFEDSILKKYNEVEQIKEMMRKTGALGTLLAGSGLSVFGIYKDELAGKKAESAFLEKYPMTYLTGTL